MLCPISLARFGNASSQTVKQCCEIAGMLERSGRIFAPAGMMWSVVMLSPTFRESRIIGDIVSIKDDSIVIETTTDRVRVEFAKFAVSTNNTAEKEAAKQKAAALAARKAEKEKAKKEK